MPTCAAQTTLGADDYVPKPFSSLRAMSPAARVRRPDRGRHPSPRGPNTGCTPDTAPHTASIPQDYEEPKDIGWTPRVSPDARQVVYRAAQKGKEFVVVDTQKGPEFGHVRGAVFSPDGRHLLYSVGQNGKSSVILDDQAGPAFEDVTHPFVSADGPTEISDEPKRETADTRP